MKPGILATNPSAALGTALTAIAGTAFALTRALGWDVTAELEGSAINLITALLMLPIVAGFLIRLFVFSPASYHEDVDAAYEEGVSDGVGPF